MTEVSNNNADEAEKYQASAEVWLRSLLFWDVTQSKFVAGYRRFGIRSHHMLRARQTVK